MPNYKLIYFDGNGRAELIRWIFAYGDIKYIDERFDYSEWGTRKPHIYGGKVPLLMVDDKPLPQSLAQARYAAKEAGLVPKDNFQAASCDALVDSIEEIYIKYFPLFFVKGTAEEIAQKFKDLHTQAVTPFLAKLNKRLSDQPWFVGDQVSWGDLAIANAADHIVLRMPYLLDSFPAVAAHVKKVRALPKIKEWIDKRPKFTF